LFVWRQKQQTNKSEDFSMNKAALFLFLAVVLFVFTNESRSQSQPLYFPPLTGTAWETVSPASLGWCTDNIDTLMNFLEVNQTKAFIVLKDGRIVLEQYFGSFTSDSNWYWASAGKTLTAFMIGIAQHDGILSLDDSTSHYIGAGWTSCPSNKEGLIKVLNQITMTTGLDDNVPDQDCTLPGCLMYLADAGTRWAYHTAPYTLLDSVIQKASGQSVNSYFNTKIRSKIGMNGLWVKSGYDNVYTSTARSMARFGLLALNRGVWDTNTVLADTSYFRRMTNTSQNLNLSYGYLWWLNGKASYMFPQSQVIFAGSWAPDAPNDMIAALGKNGQFINVVPSQRLIMVRMGNAPDSSFDVPLELNNGIWQKLNGVICNQTAVEKNIAPSQFLLEQNYPNPFNPSTSIQYELPSRSTVRLVIYNVLGQVVGELVNAEQRAGTQSVVWNANVSSGLYFYRLEAVSLDNPGKRFVETKKMLFMK
jgi:CubicO group peptidase (beta-lactamase class C family)